MLIAVVALMSVILINGKQSVITDPYSFIPSDASLLFETSDLQGFMKEITAGNGIFSELEEIGATAGFLQSVKQITAIAEAQEIREIASGRKVVISLHCSSGFLNGILVTATLPEGINRRRFKDLFSRIGKPVTGDAPVERKDGIYFSGGGASDSLFYYSGRGIMAVSNSKGLIQSAKRSEKGGTTIKSAEGFSRVNSSSGKGMNKSFVVFPNADKLISRAMGAENYLKTGFRLKGCAEGDLFMNENRIIISGYYSDSSAGPGFSYSSNPSGEMQAHYVLPMEVSMFEVRLSDNRLLLPEPYSRITNVFSGEYSKAWLPVNDTLPAQGIFYVALLTNPDIAEREIVSAAREIYTKSGIADDRWIEYYHPDDQAKIPVYRLPFRGPAHIFFGTEDRKDTVVAFYDKYMVSATSPEVVGRFIYSNILNKTLANSLPFRDFETALPSRASYRFYLVPSKNPQFLSRVLNPEIRNILLNNSQKVKRITAIGYQYAPSNGMIYNTLSICYEKNVNDDSGAEWATKLDTTAFTKPFLFTNHNTGAKEIFVQDHKKNGYLINQAGRVLWKVSLPELISGDVWMIDFYKNGKLQLLFSGKNYLHVIDRNGNSIEKFPVRLRYPASAPMALFDYEGNKDYRIIIPGDDRIVYAYDKSGNVVKGWNFFKTPGNVSSQAEHFRVAGKDYILVTDDVSVYFLDRTGNIRVKPLQAVSRAKNSELRLDLRSDISSVLFSSPDGTVQRVSFSGDVKKNVLKKMSGNHSFDFFDIDNDGRGEYAFIDSSKLYLYDDNFELIFERKFDSGLFKGPFPMTFSSNERKIGLFDSLNRQIWMVNNDGNISSGFPLKGASLFTVGKFNLRKPFNLLVGGDDNFLYNYRLEF
jgi:hypothetical protein